MEKKDHFSHILITVIDSMGQPEETKRFDNTNYDVEKWIQVGSLKILKDWSILSKCHLRFWYGFNVRWLKWFGELEKLKSICYMDNIQVSAFIIFAIGLDLLVGIGSFTSIFMVLLRTNWNDCTSCPYGTFCNQMASRNHMWVNLWCFIFSEER